MAIKFYRSAHKTIVPPSVLAWKQEGGELVPTEDLAAADAQDPMMEILNMAVQALEAQDPQMAMQVCAMLVEMAQGGEEAPTEEPMPEEMQMGGDMDLEMGYDEMMNM